MRRTPGHGVGFQGLAAGKHEHDERAGEVLAKHHGGDDGNAGERSELNSNRTRRITRPATSGMPPTTRATRRGIACHAMPCTVLWRVKEKRSVTKWTAMASRASDGDERVPREERPDLVCGSIHKGTAQISEYSRKNSGHRLTA